MSEVGVTGKKKVALLTNLFPNPVDEERGIFTLQIALNLKDSCDLTVISPLPFFPPIGFLRRLRGWYSFSQIPRRYSIHEIPVISPKYLILPRISDNIHARLMFYPVLKALRELKATAGVDLVNAHWLYPDGVVAAWACNKLKIPFVLTALGCDVNFCSEKPIMGRMIKDAVRQCRAITTVSADLKTKIERWGVCNNPPIDIPNGVDLSKFRIRDIRQCRQELHLKEDGKIILFVGRLSEEKGLNYLIDAVEAMVNRGEQSLRVIVVGDGPLKGFYRNLVQIKDLSDFVLFVGNQEHGSIPLWMGAANLLCLPSIREGCPNVVLEALGAGRPVIASMVGGVPEIMKDGKQGFLSEPANAEDLARCLERGLGFKWDAEDLRKSVAERSWTKVAESYYEVYCSVIQHIKKEGKLR